MNENTPTLKNIEDGSYVPEKKEDVVAPVENLNHENMDKAVTKGDIINLIIKNETAKGRVFTSNDEAVKWASRKLEQIATKMYIGGRPITCKTCGKGGCNKETGPLKKLADGYVHMNCEGQGSL